MTNLNLVCKCLGGSHLYGLNVADSDKDYRGIFLNQNVSTIIGLDRYEHQDIRNDTQDEFYFEFRHFMNSLRKTNTQSLELLFNNGQWIVKTELFQKLQDNKYRLIDSKKLFSSLSGYLHNELRLATGERTGDIGSKRRNQIEEFGFSPKNFMNLIRLCYCGTTFFNTGVYPVHISSSNKELGQMLLDLRQNPQNYNGYQLANISFAAIDKLRTSYDNRAETYEFDTDFANWMIVQAYGSIVVDYLHDVYNDPQAVNEWFQNDSQTIGQN